MSELKLYEIADEVLALDKLLEFDGGEITPEFEELEAKAMAILSSKVDSCVEYVNREKDLIALASERIKQLQEFKKSKENKLSRFNDYVENVLKKTNQQCLNGKLNQIKIRKPSQVLVIENEDAVPVEFTTVEQIVKIDKASLKEAVKSGEVDIEGISLQDGKTSLIFGLIKNK